MAKNESYKTPEPNISYDGVLKNYLENFSNRQIIKLINGAFNAAYPLDAKVERPNTETHGDNSTKEDIKRLGDYWLKVDGDLFMFEVQTSDGSEIAFRIFEYSARMAARHGKTSVGNDEVIMRFPAPVVLYLRSKPTTPKELTIKLELPNIKSVDGNVVTYRVPTIQIRDFTPAELGDKGLSVALPFYTMDYRTVNETTLARFENDYKTAMDELKVLEQRGDITSFELTDMLENLKAISTEILQKSKKNLTSEKFEEAVNMVETYEKNCVDMFAYWRHVEAESKAVGKAEGEAKGMFEHAKKTALTLLNKSRPLGEIIEVADLPEAEVLKLAADNGITVYE